MRLSNLLITATLFIAISFNAIAQGVSINDDGADPDASAILDVQSTNKGLLVPRMASYKIADIENPANGLLVFSTSDNKYYAFVEGENIWKEISYGTNNITPFVCGNALLDSRNDKSYSTVLIGDQCWMAENLKVDVLTNGTAIPYESQSSNWSTATSSKYCYFNNVASYGETYGYLYNFYAVSTGLLCPTGWHVPSDPDWNELITTIGGVNGGYKLKEEGTTHWLPSPNPGTNETGFTGIGSGVRYSNGTFEDLHISGNYWSSTNNGSAATWYYLRSYYGNISNWQSNFKQGISVRCIKD